MAPEDIAHRFAFHAAAGQEKRDEHTSARQACRRLADDLNGALPEGREKALAITNLELVMFWANAAIARNQAPPAPAPAAAASGPAPAAAAAGGTATGPRADLTGRHPGVTAILRHFEYAHLPDPLRAISRACHDLAWNMAAQIADDPELVAGLRDLLRAKDCFVRAVRVAGAPTNPAEPTGPGHDTTSRGNHVAE